VDSLCLFTELAPLPRVRVLYNGSTSGQCGAAWLASRGLRRSVPGLFTVAFFALFSSFSEGNFTFVAFIQIFINEICKLIC